MKINSKNINNYKMIKNKKINSLNIKDLYSEVREKSKELNIINFINDINFYLENENDRKYIEDYFKDYKYFKNSIIHIIENNNEIIILRNNNEKKFFENSHIKYLLKNRKDNEKFIDIENRLNQILINDKFMIYDYLKFDIEEIKK